MKYFWITVIFLCFQEFYSQELSAKVVDENNEPLAGATVYFDGTTRGVITNLDGVFNIDKPENINKPTLVVSYLGYETLFETNIQNLNKIYQLKPKADNLDTVNLYASPFSREEMLEVFKDNFLGRGKPARQCEILNIDDIIVYYVVKEKTLYATSANPIIVQNDYLGYKVKFDLKAFKAKFNTKTLDQKYLNQTFYAGFSFFDDIDPDKSNLRQKVYDRSLDKFFKSLIEGSLEKTKFEVGYRGFIRKPDYIFEITPLENNLYKINLKSNVIKTFNDKYIPSRIILKYKSDMSTLQFQKPYCRVDQFGNNIDIQHVSLIGELSESKVAKMLPTNFSERD